ALVAEVTRHTLALDDARRVGARSDGAGTTVLRVAVRVGTAAGLVALDDALEAAALRRAGDLDRVADGEHVDLHEVADVVRRDLDLRVARLVEPNAAQHRGRIVEARLLPVPDFRQVRAATLRRALALRRVAAQALLAEAELERRVPDFRLVGH